jgi:uncharacterized protein
MGFMPPRCPPVGSLPCATSTFALTPPAPRTHRRAPIPTSRWGTRSSPAFATLWAMPLPTLNAIDARVLAVLVEKELTVPDTYPLSLNALVAGCNQKTNRDPLMQVSDGEVLEALDRLRRASLVIESSGGRVMRYAQNAKPVLGIPRESVALLATLMLRGPQTAAELRANTERLHRFSDLSAIEAYLRELAERSAGALVTELPRQPGARETRWMHLLTGSPAVPVATTPIPLAPERPVALEARIERLESDVAELRATVVRLLRRDDPKA